MRICNWAFRIIILVLTLAAAGSAQNPALDHFEKEVRPILAERCYFCHSTSSPSPQDALMFDSVQGIRRGGNSGPVVDTQDPERSLILRALRYTDRNVKMPPGGLLFFPAPTRRRISTRAKRRSKS